MNDDVARLKLTAFLHDPPQKPLVLHLGHEAIARDLARILLGEIDDENAALSRQADHLASAADRVVLGDQRASFLSHPFLTHPLAPYSLPLMPIGPALEPRSLKAVVTTALETIRRRTTNVESAYLTVWRYLSDYLRAVEPPESRLGTLWDFLPADTRVPDHSIWTHQSVTAALAGALAGPDSVPTFLVFGIGPVQDFISTARTTRDLWVGSFLLSLLSWEAMRSVADEWGPDCVLYPSLRGVPLVDDWLIQRGAQPPDLPTRLTYDRGVAAFPNKFLALLPSTAAARAGQRASDAVDTAWQRILAATRDLAKSMTDLDDGAWDRQGSTLIEKYWITLEWPNGSLDEWFGKIGRHIPLATAERLDQAIRAYRSVRPAFVNEGTAYDAIHALAQRAYDYRKGLRDFRQVAEPGFKCTLCGVRSPVIDGEASYREQHAAWQRVGQRVTERLGGGLLSVDGAERLCAVCLTKRLAPIHHFGGLASVEEAFPSTSTVATLPYRQRLLEALGDDEDLAFVAWEFADAIDDLAHSNAGRVMGIHPWMSGTLAERVLGPTARGSGAVREIRERLARLDGEWFLLETYDRLEREIPEVMRRLLQQAQNALGRLSSKATPRCGQPSAYYAVLLADGDHMGKWVTGAAHQIRIGERLHPDVRRDLESAGHLGELLGMRRLLGPSGHAAISGALRDYSLWTVPYTLEKESTGFVVYAGGDDVLALLPGPEALQAADRLRRRYAEEFVVVDESGQLVETPPAGGRSLRVAPHMGSNASVSAGIVFAHHLYPLNAVLGYARELEEAAKTEGRRDAIAIGVIRRSGPEEALIAKWQGGTESSSAIFVEVLKDLCDLLASHRTQARPRLARGFPSLLHQLAAGLSSDEGGTSLPLEARRALLADLVRRHTEPPSQRNAAVTRVEAASAALGNDLRQLARASLLARFLASEVR